MWRLLKPAPFPPEIKDSSEVDRLYRYWRVRIFYSIYAGYALFYFTRKSFTFAMPMMVDDLGMSMADLGILGSVLYITYGFSKFLSSVVSDRSNPRYFMAIGLMLTGICNILFGMSSSLWAFAIFWGMNGLFQGWGWPPCTKQLTYWFSKSERGFWWGLKSTSHNVGGALIPLLVAVVSAHMGWRYSMFIPGAISIFCGLWLMERLRDVPQSLGLPPVEVYKKETSEREELSSEGLEASKPLGARQILLQHVLNNSAVWLLALSYFFVYVVRTAINDWGALYLVKGKGYPDMLTAASGIAWFEVGGFAGTLIAGWASDRWFQGRRVSYMMYCALGVILTVTGFYLVPKGYVWLDALCMGALGFLIFGPQMLVGLAAAEFVDKQAACTANGFAGCFAYVGAAATGYPLGKLMDAWGWEGFFGALIACSGIMFVIWFPLWLKQVRLPEIREEGISA